MKQDNNRTGAGTKGIRMTKQRQLLLDILRESNGHVDAEELYLKASKREPLINRSTVYRNLQLFSKLGIIEERHFDDAHHHYEFHSSPKHHHLRCLSCGKVIELESGFAEKVIKETEKKSQFKIVGTEFLMVGYCKDCQASSD